MIDFDALLIDRTKFINFKIQEDSAYSCGWVGGNIPDFFVDNEHFFEQYRSNYYFYLSLENPLNTEKMFSIFVPRDYNDLLKSMIYSECSIMIFEHDVAKESLNSEFTNASIEKHYISKGVICDNFEPSYMDERDDDDDEFCEEEPFFIKFGGNPVLIQDEMSYSGSLHRDAFKFLFQIDEQGYDKEMIKGNYPFGFGSVYIYARIAEDNGVADVCAGYWMC